MSNRYAAAAATGGGAHRKRELDRTVPSRGARNQIRAATSGRRGSERRYSFESYSPRASPAAAKKLKLRIPLSDGGSRIITNALKRFLFRQCLVDTPGYSLRNRHRELLLLKAALHVLFSTTRIIEKKFILRFQQKQFTFQCCKFNLKKINYVFYL